MAAAAPRPGQFILVEYDVPGPPVVQHERLVVAVDPGPPLRFFGLSPDGDYYLEDAREGGDIRRVTILQHAGEEPEGIDPDTIHAFRSEPRQMFVDGLALIGAGELGIDPPPLPLVIMWTGAEPLEGFAVVGGADGGFDAADQAEAGLGAPLTPGGYVPSDPGGGAAGVPPQLAAPEARGLPRGPGPQAGRQAHALPPPRRQLMAAPQAAVVPGATGLGAPHGPPQAQAAAGVPPGLVPPPTAASTLKWYALEDRCGYQMGNLVAHTLPLGALVQGDRAVVHAGGQALVVGQMSEVDAAELAEGDMRTLPVFFDPQGERRRTITDATALCSEKAVPGGFRIAGPRTLMWTMKYVRDNGGSFFAAHEMWVRASKVAPGDRSIYEHEVISRVLDAAASQDQLNLPSLESFELLSRRMALIKEAHRLNPVQPDYSMADHFMGWGSRASGAAIAPQLSAHVASEARQESAIAKEARKAREERQQHPYPKPPKGKGKGRGDGGAGGGQDPAPKQ